MIAKQSEEDKGRRFGRLFQEEEPLNNLHVFLSFIFDHDLCSEQLLKFLPLNVPDFWPGQFTYSE